MEHGTVHAEPLSCRLWPIVKNMAEVRAAAGAEYFSTVAIGIGMQAYAFRRKGLVERWPAGTTLKLSSGAE